MIRPTITALLILLQIICLPLSRSSTQYTITPDHDSIPRNQSCHSCLTLQQFATNVSDHLNNSTTLIFQPGRHLLSLGVAVSNVTTFTIYCNYYSESGNTCTLHCNQKGQFVFSSVQYVHIRNIDFIECIGSKVMNAGNFTLSKTSFTGSIHVTRGSALEIVRSSALLNDCSFNKYLYGTYRWTITSIPHDTFSLHRTKKQIGGALIITHSNVTIIRGSFKENRAQFGGAIYAENGSRITIIKSKFVYNAANSSFYTHEQTAAGGSLYAINKCSIFVYDSHFDNSHVYHGYRLGGTMAVYQGLIHVVGSMLSNSMADLGAVMYLSESQGVFNQSNCSSNRAFHDGGVLYSVNSSLNLHNIVFLVNKAVKGGVLFLSESSVTVHNSMFIRNSAIEDGGVIYAKLKSGWSVKSCQFMNNSAKLGGVIHTDSTDQEMQAEKSTFLYNKANSDGGVFYFNNYEQSSTKAAAVSRVNIKQSKFRVNNAKNKGGVYCKPYDNKLVIKDSNNVYKGNEAETGGLMYISDSIIEVSNTYAAFNTAQQGILLLSNTRVTYSGVLTFYKNLASAIIVIESEVHFHGMINFTANEDMDSTGKQEGGAITSTLSVLVFNGKGVFRKNRASGYGGAICSINSIIHVLGDTELFDNWAVRGGGMYLYQSDLLLKRYLHLIDNHANISGGGIHSQNSFTRISSKGSLLFMRNSAQLGGGIFLTRSSKINVQGIPEPGIDTKTPWAITIRFIHNEALYGGGIYIDDETNPLSCIVASDSESPARLENECFFQVARTHTTLYTVIKYMFFNLNEAYSGGPDLYGGLFDRCTPISGVLTFDQKLGSVEYLLTFSNIKTVSLSVSSQPVRVCFCRNNRLDCDYQPSQRNVTKGQQFVIELVAVDQVNNTLAASINALTSSPESRVGLGQQSQQAQNICTILTYEVYSTKPSEELILYADGPCQNANLSSRSIRIHFLPCSCQAGFMASLQNKWGCECICHKQLQPYLKGCNSSTSRLVRNSHAWMDIVSNNNVTEGYLVHRHCPYDYCLPSSSLVAINLNVEGGADVQCAFNRSGMLCGSCKPPLSLALGSSKCLQCSNYWLLLLIPFCLAGIALVVLLLILDINVSKGTLNSVVFYSNTVVANRAILIPLEKYNFLAMFISWLSLDLGIETCFANGLDTYSKTWLQFIFPTYIFIIVFVIIVICQHSQKLSNLLGGHNPIATLATLVWLSNAKYFRTILSIVSFTHLKYPNNKTVSLWFPDGNIHYLKGKHIALFLVSLLIIIAAMVYIFVLLCWQWLVCLPKCKIIFWVRNTKCVSLMDAYHAPYKARHRYWPGLLLFINIIQYFISAFNTTGNPAVNLFAVITVLTVYKGVVLGVYKSWLLDALESTIHINLILFASSTTYITEIGGNQEILANISLGFVFITFVVIISYHILVLLFRDKTISLVKRFKRNGQRILSVSDYLDEFDHDSHQLINYMASKEDEESDKMSVTSNAKDSTY